MDDRIAFYILIILNSYTIHTISGTQVSPVSSGDLQYQRFCHDNQYCRSVWDRRSLCVPSLQNVEIKECHCFPNFKFNESNKTCEPFRCREDRECQDWDIKRVCRSGHCVCELTYEEQSSDLYLCVHIVFETPTSLLWLWLLFVVPIIAVLSVIVLNVYKCRTRDRNRFRY